MPNLPLILDYANLFCGSAPQDEAASNHLVLSEVKLPGWEQQYVDHRPGGAPVAVEIDVIMTRLECEFTLVGLTPQVMLTLRAWEPQKNDFYIYGNARSYLDDFETGRCEAFQVAARLRGQLSHVDPQPFRRGDLFHIRYAIRGITFYELEMAEQPIYSWDFFANELRIG